MRPMHGSVSQKPIDELATEYVVLLMTSNEDCDARRNVFEELCRRIGRENSNVIINRAATTYRLLVPAT